MDRLGLDELIDVLDELGGMNSLRLMMWTREVEPNMSEFGLEARTLRS